MTAVPPRRLGPVLGHRVRGRGRRVQELAAAGLADHEPRYRWALASGVSSRLSSRGL